MIKIIIKQKVKDMVNFLKIKLFYSYFDIKCIITIYYINYAFSIDFSIDFFIIYKFIMFLFIIICQNKAINMYLLVVVLN